MAGQQIETPSVPDLPSPGERYERLYFNQHNFSLRLFFVKLFNSLQTLFGPRGGQYVNKPYGAFQDTTDQTAANTTTAYAVTFNTTDFSNGVSIASGSRITVSQSGLYNLEFSIQFKNTTNDIQDLDLWFRKNGTNIDGSNSRFGLPARKSSGDPSHLIAAINFYLNLSENDYVEIMWRPSSTGVSIEFYGTDTSPTRPSTPSAIATLTHLSNITP